METMQMQTPNGNTTVTQQAKTDTTQSKNILVTLKLVSFNFLNYYYLYQCVYLCAYTKEAGHAMAHMWATEDNLGQSALFFQMELRSSGLAR